MKLDNTVFLGTLIPLNDACRPGRDTCEDANADCLRGFCRCRPAFFQRRAVCGNTRWLQK